METFLLPSNESSNILSGLWRMRVREELCDVNIQAQNVDRNIPAHRCVLAASSPYFKAMFTSCLSESWQRDVKIAGVDTDILKAIVSFAYSVETSIPSDKVLDLLIAADLFQMDSLLEHCSGYLQDKLTPQNVLSTRAYAHLHRCWGLYKSCSEYILSNFRYIVNTDEFLRLSSQELQDIISDDSLRVKCEEEVYNAVKRWVYDDIDNRRYKFTALMHYVRLPFVALHFLNTEVRNEQLMSNCQKYFFEAACYKKFPERRAELRDSLRVRPRKTFGLNEVMMVIGGMNKNGSIHSIDQYDSRTDAWSTVASSPVSRYGAAACFLDSFLYIVGGSNEEQRFIDRTDVYNVVERTWTEAACMPTAKRYHAVATLFGLIMVVGGQSCNGVISSVEQYNPSNNTWSIASNSLNTPRMYHAVVELNGCLYAIGGHSGISRLTSVECLRSGHWITIAPLPEPRSVMGAAVFTGGIYIAGGYNGKESIRTVVYYDPSSNTWTDCPAMITGRSAFGLVAYNGSLYACGGFTGSLNRTVESYVPGDDGWQSVLSMNDSRIHFSVIST